MKSSIQVYTTYEGLKKKEVVGFFHDVTYVDTDLIYSANFNGDLYRWDYPLITATASNPEKIFNFQTNLQYVYQVPGYDDVGTSNDRAGLIVETLELIPTFTNCIQLFIDNSNFDNYEYFSVNSRIVGLVTEYLINPGGVDYLLISLH